MKASKFLRAGLAVAAACVMAVAVQAARVIYSQNLVDETALAYSATYTLDLGNNNLPGSNIDQLSFQAIYTSATVSAVTFVDGRPSTGTITISTITYSQTSLTGARASAKLDVASNSAMAGVAGTVGVNVSSNTFLASTPVTLYVNGNPIKSVRDYTVGSTSGTTATNLAAAISNLPGFTATATGSTVTITCSSVGSFCNSYTLSSGNNTRLTTTSSKFSGGFDHAYFTLSGTRFTEGNSWTKAAVSSNTAVSIAAAINASNLGGTFSAALTSASTVTITVISTGTVGNGYTLATSTAASLRINNSTTTTSASFAGGVQPCLVTIGTNTLTEGIDFSAGTTSTATAKAISDAIQTRMASLVRSTWSVIGANNWGLVSATSTATGASQNVFWSTNKLSQLTLVGTGSLVNGLDTNISLTADTITKSSAHGLTTGLALLLTKTAASTIPTGLTTNATYYAIKTSAKVFQLATTSTAAVLGNAVNMTAQTGGGTFTLTPLAISGTPAFAWQYSNDGSNWNNLSVSSVTMNTYTLGGASTQWDLSRTNYRYLRLNVVGPTTGGIYLKVIGNGSSAD